MAYNESRRSEQAIAGGADPVVGHYDLVLPIAQEQRQQAAVRAAAAAAAHAVCSDQENDAQDNDKDQDYDDQDRDDDDQDRRDAANDLTQIMADESEEASDCVCGRDCGDMGCEEDWE